MFFIVYLILKYCLSFSLFMQDVCNGRVYVTHKLPNVDPKQVMAKNLDTGEFCRVDKMI